MIEVDRDKARRSKPDPRVREEAPLTGVLDSQSRRMATSSTAQALIDAQDGLERRMAGWSAAGSNVQKLLDSQSRRMATSSTAQALIDAQDRLERRMAGWSAAGSNVQKLFRRHRRLGQVERSPTSASQLRDLLRANLTRFLEYLDDYAEAHWAELETKHPEYPAPVLFLIGSFSRTLGRPLLDAVTVRGDDSLLLNALEPVVTSPALVREIQHAILSSGHLNEVQKRHLITGFGWLEQEKYIDAYPPLYNGLEPGFRNVARARGLLDDGGRLTRSGKRMTKVDDLFADVVPDARYRRFLRAWVFGHRGNPFRHGDVSNPEECRRQSLRLAAAILGWLELYEEWDASAFLFRLEAEVGSRTQLTSSSSSYSVSPSSESRAC